MAELKNLPPDYVATFSRQINLLKFVGIYIFGDENLNLLNQYGRALFFGSLLLPLLIGQTLFIVRRDKTGANFLEAAAIVPIVLVILQDLTKLIVAKSKEDQLRTLIVELAEIWPRNNENERKISDLKSWLRQLKTCDNAYFASASFVVMSFLIFPLVLTIYAFTTDPTNAKYELPIQLYFFCWLDSHYQYAFAFAYLFLTCCTIHMCVYVSTDFLLVALTYDICALLSLVQIDLEEIQSSVFSSDDCSEVKNVVATHQKLLMFAKKLDDIFSPSVFIQVTLSSGIICCFGFLAIADEKLLIKCIISASGELIAIAVLAWPGQILIDTSYAVSTAAYFCPWYEKSTEFGKYIQLIIARSQRPCHLSVFAFSVLSLPMFSKVVSSSWSYLSLLMQMYRDYQA